MEQPRPVKLPFLPCRAEVRVDRHSSPHRGFLSAPLYARPRSRRGLRALEVSRTILCKDSASPWQECIRGPAGIYGCRVPTILRGLRVPTRRRTERRMPSAGIVGDHARANLPTVYRRSPRLARGEYLRASSRAPRTSGGGQVLTGRASARSPRSRPSSWTAATYCLPGP